MPCGAIFRPDAEGAFHLLDLMAGHELLQSGRHPVGQVFDSGEFFLPVVELGVHTVDDAAFGRKQDNHALAAAIGGKKCFPAFGRRIALGYWFLCTA